MKKRTLLICMMIVCIVLSGTVVFALDSNADTADPAPSVPQILDAAPAVSQDTDIPVPVGTASPQPAKTADAAETPSADSTETVGAAETPSADSTETVGATETPSADSTETADATETPSADSTETADATETPSADPTETVDAAETPSADPTGADDVTQTPSVLPADAAGSGMADIGTDAVPAAEAAPEITHTAVEEEAQQAPSASPGISKMESGVAQGSVAALYEEAEAAVRRAVVSMEAVRFHVTNHFTKYIEAASIAAGGQTVGTNSIGDASMMLVPGTYTYDISAAGYVSAHGQFTVEAGQANLVDVVLDPADMDKRYNVALQILDATAGGVPITSANVQFEISTLHTDAAGIVAMQVLYPGTYTVAVTAPGYYQKAYTFTLMDGDISQTISLDQYIEPAPAPAAASPAPRPAAAAVEVSETKSGSAGGGTSSGGRNTAGGGGDDMKELDGVQQEGGTPAPGPTPLPSAAPKSTPAPTPTSAPEKQVYNMGLNIAYLDGTPAAEVPVEIHSDVISTRTDEGGYAYFQGVEEGTHTLYVKDAQGNVVAEKQFVLSGGVKTALDLANVGGDQVYAGMGTDTVTVDAVLDEDLLVLTAVAEGEHPVTPAADEETPAVQDGNLIWMLVVSVSAAAVAVVILLVAIRRMKRAQEVDVHANGTVSLAEQKQGKD